MTKELQIKKDRNVWVYDIETLKSCFTYTALNIDTEQIVQFVIHKDRNDIDALNKHLFLCKGQIGFNSINFDYPVIHFFLNNNRNWIKKQYTPEDIAYILWDKANAIIEAQEKTTGFFETTSIALKDVKIHQLDLFKIWHFNNAARSTSLKALEIAMQLDNVMEMPIDHRRDDIQFDEINSILEYNLNDVLATYEFYKRSLQKVELRKTFQSKYNIPCLNYPDAKLGEQLILKLYCDKLNLDTYIIRKIKTDRPIINIKDCIFDYIKFETKEFNSLLDKLMNYVVTSEGKKEIKESVIFKGFKYEYGKGGIHGSIKPGKYESDNEYTIVDADVSSLYPSIAVLNNLYPEHLGKTFCEVYNDNILKPRLVAKINKDKVTSDGLKLAANAVFGKSNDDNSFLKDPLYTYKTTINGQLLLSMLAEQLVLQIEDLTMLQINTDGLTVKIKKTDIELYYFICKEWEKSTKLQLEYVEYQKMIIRDVNNYLSLSKEGKIKAKGAFKTTQDKWNDEEYHKDFSFNIVPIALRKYFFENISIEKTLREHNNILDFCGRQKFDRASYGETKTLVGDNVVIEKTNKNVRYYVSNNGSLFIKRYTKGTAEFIEKGYKVTLFNKKIDKPFNEYDIDYRYYKIQCLKEIDVIESKQLILEL